MKRQTKAQREAAQKAALLRRISDIYSGAAGCEWTCDDFALAEQLARIIPAMRELFGSQNEEDFMWKAHCINEFDNPETATEFLFRNGFRA